MTDIFLNQGESSPADIRLRDPTSNNKSITAGAGSYVLTGTNATLLHAWKIAAGAGSFTLTGTNATPVHAWKIAAGVGSYALTGTDATLPRTRKLTAGAGSFILTGTAATPLHGGVKIAAGAGSYALTGTDATLLHAWKIAAGAGSYALTGTAAILIKGKKIAADAGSYALTGADVTLTNSTPAIVVEDDGGAAARWRLQQWLALQQMQQLVPHRDATAVGAIILLDVFVLAGEASGGSSVTGALVQQLLCGVAAGVVDHEYPTPDVRGDVFAGVLRAAMPTGDAWVMPRKILQQIDMEVGPARVHAATAGAALAIDCCVTTETTSA